MPSSSPAQAPVRSSFGALKGLGALSQRAATSAAGLGEAGRLALADATTWLACPAPVDAVAVVAGDAVVPQPATDRIASTAAASQLNASFMIISKARQHVASTGRRPRVPLVKEGRLPNVSRYARASRPRRQAQTTLASTGLMIETMPSACPRPRARTQ